MGPQKLIPIKKSFSNSEEDEGEEDDEAGDDDDSDEEEDDDEEAEDDDDDPYAEFAMNMKEEVRLSDVRIIVFLECEFCCIILLGLYKR